MVTNMISVTFTQFRKDASALFTAVENGEIIKILRHGKPIAEILPYRDSANHLPSWKKRKIRHPIKGEELSSLILSEREQAS